MGTQYGVGVQGIRRLYGVICITLYVNRIRHKQERGPSTVNPRYNVSRLLCHLAYSHAVSDLYRNQLPTPPPPLALTPSPIKCKSLKTDDGVITRVVHILETRFYGFELPQTLFLD